MAELINCARSRYKIPKKRALHYSCNIARVYRESNNSRGIRRIRDDTDKSNFFTLLIYAEMNFISDLLNSTYRRGLFGGN